MIMTRPTGPKKGADLPTSCTSSDYFRLCNNSQVVDQLHPGGLCDSGYSRPFEKDGERQGRTSKGVDSHSPRHKWLESTRSKTVDETLGRPCVSVYTRCNTSASKWHIHRCHYSSKVDHKAECGRGPIPGGQGIGPKSALPSPNSCNIPPTY